MVFLLTTSISHKIDNTGDMHLTKIYIFHLKIHFIYLVPLCLLVFMSPHSYQAPQKPITNITQPESVASSSTIGAFTHQLATLAISTRRVSLSGTARKLHRGFTSYTTNTERGSSPRIVREFTNGLVAITTRIGRVSSFR